MPKKPVQHQLERRFLAQEFRVSGEGEAPKIAGYALVFDSMSDDLGYWREEIDPHALDSVMTTNPDVRALFNHDPSAILGRTSAGTLTLNLDARGLAYVITPPDTQVARDLIVSMRRKDITQSSFGFICKRDQWTENGDGTVTRRILEFEELLDVSPVTFPAYSAASSGVRSLPSSMPKEIRSKFEKRDSDNGCTCPCASCMDGDCTGCDCDGCESVECQSENCDCSASRSKRTARESAETRERMKMQLRIAEARAK